RRPRSADVLAHRQQRPDTGEDGGVDDEDEGATPPVELVRGFAPHADVDPVDDGLSRTGGEEARDVGAPVPEAEDRPGDRLDDPGDTDGDEQGRDLVGDEDAGTEADERPQAEDEQAEEERATDLTAGEDLGPAGTEHRRSGGDGSDEGDDAVEGTDPQQGDDLGGHD